jgi:hypothetical protein
VKYHHCVCTQAHRIGVTWQIHNLVCVCVCVCVYVRACACVCVYGSLIHICMRIPSNDEPFFTKQLRKSTGMLVLRTPQASCRFLMYDNRSHDLLSVLWECPISRSKTSFVDFCACFRCVVMRIDAFFSRIQTRCTAKDTFTCRRKLRARTRLHGRTDINLLREARRTRGGVLADKDWIGDS